MINDIDKSCEVSLSFPRFMTPFGLWRNRPENGGDSLGFMRAGEGNITPFINVVANPPSAN
jgi:hypothetical protein